jgi:hypothetical protein
VLSPVALKRPVCNANIGGVQSRRTANSLAIVQGITDLFINFYNVHNEYVGPLRACCAALRQVWAALLAEVCAELWLTTYFPP